MIQQLEMKTVVGETPGLKDLLSALKNKELIRFQEILEKEHDLDIDYCFGDPEHGSLLDLSCMTPGSHIFVNSLLSYGADPNIINKLRKKAPLHFAVQNNDFLTVENLLNFENTEINILDSMGNTPLHLAVKTSDSRILELFLQNKSINVNIVNRKGKSALLIALEEKNKDCINLLLKNENLELNSDPNFSKIKELLNDILPEWKVVYKLKNKSYSYALQYDNVFNLLHSGKYNDFISVIRGKENDKKFLDNSNDGSYTFIQYCCEFGLIDVLKELLILNVDPNITTSALIRTPLMIAAYKGYADIVKMLIDSGKCSFDPVNQETVLHCVVKGSSESPALGDNNELKKDHLMCLSYLLAVQRCRVYINFGDLKGNTALHFAAKQGEDGMVLHLLKAGASLNCFNVLDEPTFADINYKILKEYLDSCIYTNDKLPREETYEIILNYTGLKPACSHNLHVDNELGNLTNEDHNSCKSCNNFETKSLLYLSQHSELKYLLKHPVFTSFLHLKWHKIHKCFCINMLFYLLFWATLTFYILNFYPDFNRSDPTESSFKSINVIWGVLTMLVIMLMLREFAQFCIAPLNYLMSFENWLEIALIVVTFAILCSGKDTPFQYKVNLSAIGIMLAWSELVLLLGRHPALSTKLEMLKTVSWNFLMFLAWYSFLIAAFAISFYILFGKNECSGVEKSVCSINATETDDDFFRNPGVSFFKTVIMLTGEFDASSIPFDESPGTSHILFVAFVFLIAIVLFNLLNGLAVSDIQAIKSDAELVGYISRVKLISYIETLVLNPLPVKNRLLYWNDFSCQKSNLVSYYKNKLFSRCVNIFQNDCLFNTCEIRILPNLGNSVEINRVKCTVNRKETDFNLNCCKSSNLLEMDSGIVRSIKKILAERIVDGELKDNNNRKLENEQLLIQMMKDFQEDLKFLRDTFTECKKDIEKIKKGMNFSE